MSQLKKLYEDDQAARAALLKITNARLAEEAQRQLLLNNFERRERVDAIMQTLAIKTQMDYFYAANVYYYGEHAADFQKAHQYADRALNLVRDNFDKVFNQQLKMLYAKSYDKWQVAEGREQKYGFQRHANTGEIIGTPSSKHGKLRAMDVERKSLGVPSINEQDSELNKARKKSNEQSPSGAPRLTPINHHHVDDKKKKDEESLKPKPTICGNCGERGHNMGACIKPKKPK